MENKNTVETIEVMQNTEAATSRQSNLKHRKIVYYILGVLESLFAFRLFFKLLGANPESTLVSLIYTITGIFMAPFSGIFRAVVNKGIETKSVLEPAAIIAMIVYALIAYGVVRLIKIYEAPRNKRMV